jgi:hypothetical protein
VHGRGLLIILSFLLVPFFVSAQDSGSDKDEFTEFEELPEPTPEAEKPSIDVPVDTLEATPLPTLPDETPAEEKPEEPKIAEPAPLPTEQPPAETVPPPDLQSPSAAANEPDLKKEEQFHEVYQKYNKEPYVEKEWQEHQSKIKKQNYVVQPKDTLWDISVTFFNATDAWPKLWANNVDKISNPHEIEPKMVINFFPGSISAPPIVTVTQEKGPGGTTIQVVDEGPPPPYRTPKKLRKVPDSLPLYRMGAVNQPKTKLEIDDLTKPIETPMVFVTNYLEEGSPKLIGEIVEIESGGSTAADFQYVVVRLEDPSQKYLYTAKEIEKFKPGGGNKEVQIMELQGEMQVLESVDPARNFYRARIERTISPVMVGAKLMPGGLPRANILPTEVAQGIEANIIAGGDSSTKRLYGLDQIVYISAGSAQGVQEGQSFNIFANLKTRNSASVVQVRNRIVGRLKILRTTANFSTAFILEAIEDIWQGDIISGGTQMALSKPVEIQKAPVLQDLAVPETEEGAAAQ